MLAGQTYSQWDEQWRDRLLLTWVVAPTSGPEASGSYPSAFAPLRSLRGLGGSGLREGRWQRVLQCVPQGPGEKRRRRREACASTMPLFHPLPAVLRARLL